MNPSTRISETISLQSFRFPQWAQWNWHWRNLGASGYQTRQLRRGGTICLLILATSASGPSTGSSPSRCSTNIIVCTLSARHSPRVPLATTMQDMCNTASTTCAKVTCAQLIGPLSRPTGCTGTWLFNELNRARGPAEIGPRSVDTQHRTLTNGWQPRRNILGLIKDDLDDCIAIYQRGLTITI